MKQKIWKYIYNYHRHKCMQHKHVPISNYTFNLGNSEIIIVGCRCKYCNCKLAWMDNGKFYEWGNI